MEREMVIVLDFGGQYNQLIARRVRECNVYCEVHPYTMSIEKIREMNPKGIIFTGGPNSVYGEDSPTCSSEIYELGVPILGICYGSQLMAHMNGGKVTTAPVSEYGKTEVEVDDSSVLFEDVSPKTICWMSHTDYIEKAPENFRVTAHTPVCPVAAMENAEKKLYAVQFHPEVMHTQEGVKMLSNFVYKVCGCSGDWKMDSFVETTIAQIREKVETARCSAPFPAAWIPPCCGASFQGCGQAAHLRFRRSRTAPQKRGRRGGRDFRPQRPVRFELHPCQRPGALLCKARWPDRPGSKAQDHRRGIHPRF